MYWEEEKLGTSRYSGVGVPNDLSQDMDLDEGDMDSGETGNFMDELNSFYSEIGKKSFLMFFNFDINIPVVKFFVLFWYLPYFSMSNYVFDLLEFFLRYSN